MIARVKTDADALRAETGAAVIPADAVTASASGLDPHISPAYAELQIARIASARGVGEAQVREVIAERRAFYEECKRLRLPDYWSGAPEPLPIEGPVQDAQLADTDRETRGFRRRR